MPQGGIGGRSYVPKVYRAQRRTDIYEFITSAFQAGGGSVLYTSSPAQAPFVFSVSVANDERFVVIVYAFRCNPPPIRGRPADEHRVQVRYGSEASWEDDHPLAHDVAGADVTVVLGVHLEAEVLVGLDPFLYDPLPMGISVELKDADIQTAKSHGWHVWERDNVSGTRRSAPRAANRLETIVGFAPGRLMDYVRLERQANTLKLDPPLRFRAALSIGQDSEHRAPTVHRLEQEFQLPAETILQVVAERRRLGVALRGGVAEYHLADHLASVPEIIAVEPLDEDGQHDFDVVIEGRSAPVRIECKNCSPRKFADGTPKVEVQKTRASKGDPASRYYRTDQFDVVAVCLFSATGSWDFAFKATAAMDRHNIFTDRLAAIHRVDESWSRDLTSVLDYVSTGIGEAST